MKCTLLKEILEEHLSLSSRFTSSRVSTVQALQGVHIEAKGKKIIITTTNLSEYFYTELAADVDEEGIIVCDLKKMLEFLNFLETGPVTISTEENEIKLEQGKTHGYFSTYPVGDFPSLPSLDGKEYTLSKKLIDKLSMIILAASKDETRPVMTGIFITNKDDKGIFVSTDGFRLSLLEYDIKQPIPEIILPSSVFQELIRFSKGEEDIIMTLSPEDRLVKFTLGGMSIYSRVIEGQFPPYEKVIPTSSTTHISIDKQEFIKNIRLVSVFAREQSDVIILDIQDETMIIRPRSSRKKSSEIFQKLESFKGEPLKIAFNYKYILDFLNNAKDETIEIELTQPTAPAVFKNYEEETQLHIIMPLRTEETTG